MIFRAVEDPDLIRKARRGDVEAFNLLISRWEKRVFNYLLRILQNREDALDLSQDVFLKAYQNLRKLEEPERFAAWLFRIARNTCYSHRRKEKLRRLFTPLLPVHEAVASAEPSPLSGKLAAVNEALKHLSLRDRELLALCTQDFSYDQMAAITSLTVANLKTRLFRARQALKRILAHE